MSGFILIVFDWFARGYIARFFTLSELIFIILGFILWGFIAGHKWVEKNDYTVAVFFLAWISLSIIAMILIKFVLHIYY